ncbi:RNA polymerase, sigma 28 subunit, SigD/FliA/WhiG [Schinkia azotoformans MEV2011]|uniref:RNA polymerase, sigma 28 subunit, SigD/FliA/WhiG n=1 Tax=Schinkia azotoformans MEV2011 TaxID=1348973 RepID=A0A072NRN3_SCHAZ|nr:FliA/WhiG family RNA polymerase sigma factor [Schinkia azotoformans]KEF39902.1 RNA polymerase, sigma 28 subunit, SigD/FliA/WhiG [Schinkia azotoformans MEV2011]MEC1697201.1 FliA/WhiG family RNA polymerase sigma factor [Schinkia azotoformans]MEC1715266.1 FliA/WhiG family RNA polymerase sigma factor [Schinkia azotoformans]MEC1724240.1 FliA/WhiG family RNA polymerase sigma factor [Schinkia azotoformans]MEC1740983.1 FliA/WhiG family RNA polymerase sigma factor [Schinkia azotoformans]
MTRIPSNEDQIWQKWINNKDPQAGDSLIRLYMPLVSYHVQRISVGLPKSVNREDVKSYGLMGLYDALEKFDLSRDLKFDTYASFRIRGAILDGLRKEDWLPRSLREKNKKIEATIERLEQRFMRNVTVEEIAAEVEMTEDEVNNVITEGFFANILSIDESNKDSDEKEGLSFSVRDKNSLTPEEHTIKEELYNELADAIVELNDKEQLVVSLFYHEELTLTEIGQVLGLSTSRISQIHSKALFKLRSSLGKIMAM